MFPKEKHVKILQRIDTIEAELYRLYRSLERLRLDLQRDWQALPSDAPWNERSQAASEYSAAETAKADPR